MAAGAMASTDDMLLNSSKLTSGTIPCAWTNLTRILKGLNIGSPYRHYSGRLIFDPFKILPLCHFGEEPKSRSFMLTAPYMLTLDQARKLWTKEDVKEVKEP